MLLATTVFWLTYGMWVSVVMRNGYKKYKQKTRHIPKKIESAFSKSQRRINRQRSIERLYYKDMLKANTVAAFIPIFNIYLAYLLSVNKKEK